MSKANNRNIAKNTLFLYLRMLVTLGVSLYTSRVVLDVLGVRDYGVYNVVGGLIVILSFLNGTMSGATQRFLNYEMGRGDNNKLKTTFTAAWVIHLSIAGILLLIGETVGLWFVNNVLVIAPERIYAANWTYQFSLIGGLLTVLSVPFNGAIFAHERMNIYAYITLTFTFLKLGIAILLLYWVTADNLVIYAALMMGASFVQFMCYFIYCLRHFDECSISIKADRSAIKSMIVYSGSDLIGTTCYTVESQGVLVLLNRFGGTVLNAAGGLAVTINGALNQFGTSIVMAFRPQIIKQYAAKDYEYMQTLMINCSKFSILLLAIFAAPVILEMDYILNLWLKEVPAYTAAFARLALLTSVTNMTILTLNAGMHATGKIFMFSTLTGLSFLIELPIMWICMKLTGNPEWAYIIPIFQLLFNAGMICVMLHNRLPSFNIRRYAINGFFMPVAVTCIVGLSSIIPHNLMQSGFMRLITVGFWNAIFLCMIAWTILLTPENRKELVSIIKKKLHLG